MMYFAYGSNLDWVQMKGRCPSARFVCIALLPDHKLTFPRKSVKRHGGVADVEESTGDEVWGVVYEIEEEDVSKLDECEGFDRTQSPENNAYNPKTVIVFPEGDRSKGIQVILYKAVPKEQTKPSGAYMDLIVYGARFWHLPEHYIHELESIEVKKSIEVES